MNCRKGQQSVLQYPAAQDPLREPANTKFRLRGLRELIYLSAREMYEGVNNNLL